MTIGRYSELAAWQSSMSLVADVYRLTTTMPVAEKFGLAQQLRRAAVSIPSNIAEGHARRSRREYLRFVVVAMGSLAELETQLLIAHRLAYVTASTLSSAQRRVDETGKLLRGLERRLIRDSALGSGP